VNETQLVQRARQGDSQALEELLRLVQPEVLRICGSLLRRRQDAEEACQDALMAVVKGIDRFEARSTVRTWARTIAVNSARQTSRKLRRHAVEHPTDELPVVADRRTTSGIVASKVDLLDALDQLERRWPTVARALALRELADLEYTEIAAELGLPINTVKTFLHRGRHHVRELLTAHID
jgi:RNA polymerase sigma-70 factor (ECF subfamily)